MEQKDKKFYWIKLRTDFFQEDSPIDFLMSQENGAEYVVLYQMLCLKTANMNGHLSSQVGEIIIPYDIKKIVRDTKYFDVDTVTVALELFKRIGLIYQQEDGNLVIANYSHMIGNESASKEAIAKRKQREKQAEQLRLMDIQQDNVEDIEMDKMSDKVSDRDKSIEIRDKEIRDKDINKKRNIKEKEPKHIFGTYSHVRLTDSEYERLCKDYGEKNVKDGIDNVDKYCQKSGKTYKDYNLVLRDWGIKSPKLTKPTPKPVEPQEEEISEEELIRQLDAEGVKWIT